MTGQRSAFGVRGLLGRDPAPATGDRFEHLITLAEDTLSVSKTHLEFGTGESGLWIRDRSSTNGSVIEVNGHRAAVPPGMRVPAPAGSTIHIGALLFMVRARRCTDRRLRAERLRRHRDKS
jgi:hypothetical protein